MKTKTTKTTKSTAKNTANSNQNITSNNTYFSVYYHRKTSKKGEFFDFLVSTGIDSDSDLKLEKLADSVCFLIDEKIVKKNPVLMTKGYYLIEFFADYAKNDLKNIVSLEIFKINNFEELEKNFKKQLTKENKEEKEIE